MKHSEQVQHINGCTRYQFSIEHSAEIKFVGEDFDDHHSPVAGRQRRKTSTLLVEHDVE